MVYRTMQGQIVDMDKLMQKHELTPAVGNAKMNARGDKLGPGGKIVKTREEIVAEYYEANPKAKVKAAGARVIETPIPEPAPAPASPKSKKSQTEE
jgi:hypothetical protein